MQHPYFAWLCGTIKMIVPPETMQSHPKNHWRGHTLSFLREGDGTVSWRGTYTFFFCVTGYLTIIVRILKRRKYVQKKRKTKIPLFL